MFMYVTRLATPCPWQTNTKASRPRSRLARISDPVFLSVAVDRIHVHVVRSEKRRPPAPDCARQRSSVKDSRLQPLLQHAPLEPLLRHSEVDDCATFHLELKDSVVIISVPVRD